MIFGTVITASHWPKAKLLAASIRRSIPDAKIVICLVERTIPDELRGTDEIWLAKDLSNTGDFDKRIFRYKPFEACCSVKPLLLRELMIRFPEENHFVIIDSDIQVFSPFKEIEDLLTKHPIILTPHHLNYKAPPWLYNYALLYGIFNAGLIAANSSETSRRFAEWWIERTHRHAQFDIKKGLFAEQRWLNFCPVLFHAKPIKHPGYNVASWNLHERNVSRSSQGEFMINGEHLRCFHYHNHQELLKRCKEGEFNNNSTLLELVNSYVTALKNLNEVTRNQWSYGYFENGEEINEETRKIYGKNIGYEKLPMSPFELSNNSFMI
ncbi:hypothetical protein V7147_23150 [Bacillus sp. JJ1521]|uniref:hypothetical protein n=1 Tax=Bacillus sp. JJ1521 TaxID=3122957 RepID=UPI002FFDA698